MRVLFITSHVTSNKHPAFFKPNKQTGFGYMVHDIANEVGKNVDVDVFCSIIFSPSLKIGNYNVIGHNLWSMLKYFRCEEIRDMFSYIKKYQPSSFKTLIKVIGKYLIFNQVDSIVDNYDFVHIHGITDSTYPAVDLCIRHKIPFLVTLHGLNSFESNINEDPQLKKLERDFLFRSYVENIPISFISTGNIQTCEDFLNNNRI